jgi:hypothetical protein
VSITLVAVAKVPHLWQNPRSVGNVSALAGRHTRHEVRRRCRKAGSNSSPQTPTAALDRTFPISGGRIVRPVDSVLFQVEEERPRLPVEVADTEGGGVSRQGCQVISRHVCHHQRLATCTRTCLCVMPGTGAFACRKRCNGKGCAPGAACVKLSPVSAAPPVPRGTLIRRPHPCSGLCTAVGSTHFHPPSRRGRT